MLQGGTMPDHVTYKYFYKQSECKAIIKLYLFALSIKERNISAVNGCTDSVS